MTMARCRDTEELHGVKSLFIAHGKERLWAHSKAVARGIAPIAAQYGLTPAPCRVAALCHDIAGILSPVEMLQKARESGMELDPAEEKYPSLLHQRLSSRWCADRLGITDTAVLSAVGCHTTLKAGATAMDMALFLAGKLYWDGPGAPPYEAVVRKELTISLERACLAYIDYVLAHGMILMPHRWLMEARGWLIPFSVSF